MANKRQSGEKTPVKQGAKDYEVGNCKPPKNRQFGQPEGNKRSDGRWNPKYSISFQYGEMMKMTVKQFKEWARKNPENKRTMAQEIAYKRAYDARNDPKKGLATTIEITDRTEGKARQAIDLTADAYIQTDNPLAGLSIEDLKKLAKGINL